MALLQDNEAQSRLFSGVEKASKAVMSTLGAAGKTVLIDKEKSLPPIITKDGVTVARNIKLEDDFEQVGVKLIQNIASSADREGDGTTTATTIAYSIIKQYNDTLNKHSINVNQVVKGIDIAYDKIKELLKHSNVEIKDNKSPLIEKVALTSSNHDKSVADVITQAYLTLGKDGIIVTELGKVNSNTILSIVEGIVIHSGYKSPYFITNPKTLNSSLDEPLILCSNMQLTFSEEIQSILEHCMNQQKPIVFFTKGIDEKLMSILLVNHSNQNLNSCVIDISKLGMDSEEQLKDIAVSTTSKIIYDKDDFYKVEGDAKIIDFDIMGTARRVITAKHDTTIVEGKCTEENIKNRIDELTEQVKLEDSMYNIERINLRKANLVGGIGEIIVGGVSDVEKKELKFRIDDSLNSTKSAIKFGTVTGGGAALFHISKIISANRPKSIDNKSKRIGYDIMCNAIRQPFATILTNGGFDVETIADKLQKKKNMYGFDVINEKIINMYDAGIVDSYKVIDNSLTTAVKLSKVILTTNSISLNHINLTEK